MSKQGSFSIKKDVNGILNLDKPLGISSNQALQKVKNLFQAKKAGHTGNLDPLATGVLPICFGHATKVSQYLLDADKTYLAELHLGILTSTGDKEGSIINQENIDYLNYQQIENCVLSFTGEQQQTPPMYSAVKYQGQPLYKLAREGKIIERKSRTITIYSLSILEFKPPYLSIEVACSKGTYIRTLAESIGNKLGCGACLSSLRRTQAGCFHIYDAIKLDELELHKNNLLTMNLLTPVDQVLENYPFLVLSASQSEDVVFGKKIIADKVQQQVLLETLNKTTLNEPVIRLYNSKKIFIGLALYKNNIIFPKRMFL